MSPRSTIFTTDPCVLTCAEVPQNSYDKRGQNPLLLAGFGGQGRVKAELGLWGCLHKATYTNWTCLREGFEIPICCPIYAAGT